MAKFVILIKYGKECSEVKMVKKTLLRMFIMLLCSVAVGYLLLVIAFCIPRGRIFKGLADSVPVIERDIEEEVIFGYPSSRLDIFSDGAILNAVLHTNNEGPLRRAIACYQYVYKDLSRAQAFIVYFEPRDPDKEVQYIRYWHGILAVLKPLFLFFNYSDLRMLNLMGQLILMCLTVAAFIKKGLHRFVPAVLIAYFFLMPFTLPMSIQYSPVFYIGFTALALLVYFYDRLKGDRRFLYLFFMTGILTTYMDLLTYPMFTLGMPLVGLLIMKGSDRGQSHKFTDTVKDFVLAGVSWGAGYALMWLSKILIAIPFFGVSALSDAAVNAQKRSAAGASAEGITYTDALNSNFFMYKNPVFKTCLIVYTFIMLAFLLYMFVKKGEKLSAGNIVFYLAAGLIPFAWFLVTTEHAQIHAFMTYKNFAVTVFAYCAMLASILGYGKNT